ncbi:MAG: osmotically inducible protein OsmC [Robiginitomaculum sp.]|nr:MAG: osmotically inducible protein OsmC [Robiginitomaculum sp.]
MGNSVTVKERAGGLYTQDVLARHHHLYADEPESLGSADLGPTPFEFVCAGLGACTTITLRMYSERKKWPVTHIAVDVHFKKSGVGTDMKNVFVRDITIEGDLDEAQRTRLLQIANKCPVHKMLEAEAEIRSSLV